MSALLAVLPLLCSGETCETRAGCASCLSGADADGVSPCKWCYSSRRCARNDAPSSDLCPIYATHPAVCACEPSVQGECHTCVSKLDCVWIEEGTMNMTSKLPGAFSVARARSWDGVCWSGSMFAGPTRVMDVVAPSVGYKVVTTRQATAWYWGQCALKNHSFAWTLLLLLVATFAMGLAFRAMTVSNEERRAPEPGAIQF